VARSAAIQERLFEFHPFRLADCVLFFMQVRREVRTEPMIHEALALGKRIGLPVTHVEDGSLEFREVTDLERDLEATGALDIPEPRDHCRSIPPAAVDLVVAPGVGFDQRGYRIGYGGGFYDYYWWWNDVPEKLNTKNYVYDPWTDITYKNNWHTYLSDFSSRPNKTLGQSRKDLDVSAPGAAIRGPYKPEGPLDWGYYAVWGTSQAAPHVSGIAALLLESYSELSQADMEWILKRAATKVPMPPDGAYVSDVFSDFAAWYYYWSDRDSGSGFLTLDEAMWSARLYRR